jgi:hypothetical protein
MDTATTRTSRVRLAIIILSSLALVGCLVFVTMNEDATASAQEIITEQVSTETESEWEANDLSDHEKNKAAKAGQPAKFPKDKVSEVIQTGKKGQKTKYKYTYDSKSGAIPCSGHGGKNGVGTCLGKGHGGDKHGCSWQKAGCCLQCFWKSVADAKENCGKWGKCKAFWGKGNQFWARSSAGPVWTNGAWGKYKAYTLTKTEVVKSKKKPAKKPANPKRPYASPVAHVLTSSLKVNCMHTKAFCTAVVDKLDEDTGNSFGVLKGLCNALGLKPNKKNVTPEACTKQYEKFMTKQESLYKKGITHMQLRHIRRSMAKNGILVKNKKRKIEFNGKAVGLLDKLGPYDKVTATVNGCRMAMKDFRELFDQAIAASPTKMAASIAAGLSKKQQKSFMRWKGDVAVPLLEDLMAAEAASLE